MIAFYGTFHFRWPRREVWIIDDGPNESAGQDIVGDDIPTGNLKFHGLDVCEAHMCLRQKTDLRRSQLQPIKVGALGRETNPLPSDFSRQERMARNRADDRSRSATEKQAAG